MDLTTQIEQWVIERNREELQKCEFVVAKALRQWQRVVDYMETDKRFAKDAGAMTIARELKRLKLAVKRVDRFFESETSS